MAFPQRGNSGEGHIVSEAKENPTGHVVCGTQGQELRGKGPLPFRTFLPVFWAGFPLSAHPGHAFPDGHFLWMQCAKLH